MAETLTKDARLNIRVDRNARKLLDRAAGYARLSVSEFVLSRAVASAREVVQAQESIMLSPAQFEAFLAVLDRPAKPNAALKRTFRRHAGQVRA